MHLPQERLAFIGDRGGAAIVGACANAGHGTVPDADEIRLLSVMVEASEPDKVS